MTAYYRKTMDLFLSEIDKPLYVEMIESYNHGKRFPALNKESAGLVGIATIRFAGWALYPFHNHIRSDACNDSLPIIM